MTGLHYKNLRFLIVDNIKPSHDILKQFALRLTDQQVDSTHYAQDVSAICQEKQYDVILLGYDLGDRQKNGQQILEELRVNNYISRHCVVILITAEVSQAMVLAALEHKPDDYLCKPYSLNELDKRLSKCLKKKQLMSPIYQALDLGDPNLVIEFCDKALASNTPYATECQGIKSRQLFELKQFNKAKKIYTEFQSAANCQWANIGLGKVALHENKLINAEQIFKNLIKKYPMYLSSYDWLAITYQEQLNFLFAEEVLEQALNLSPRSIIRLKKYAKLCLNNHHFDKATFAYDQTYKLANNSIHHAPENAIMFAKALVEYTPSLALSDAKKWKTKACGYFQQSNRDFRDIDLKIQSHLLSACLHEITRDTALAKENIVQGEKLLAKEQANLSAETLKDISNTLIKLNRHGPASQILIASQNATSTQTSEQDESSSHARRKAQEAIEKSQLLYEKQEYSLAINKLVEAQKLYPKHIGIKLNLLQALLLSYEDDNNNLVHYSSATKLIKDLSNADLNNSDDNRLKKMQKKYMQLTN